jgi:hypothetical protein
MTQAEWTPARGWVKVAVHLPVRAAVGFAAIIAIAWAIDAMHDSTGAEAIGSTWLFAGGAIAGVLLGAAIGFRLDESTGLAGRSLFLAALPALLVVIVVAWNTVAAMLPWEGQVVLWMMLPVAAAALVTSFYLLWLMG